MFIDLFDYIESTYKSTSAITEKQTIDWAWPATDGAPRYPACGSLPIIYSTSIKVFGSNSVLLFGDDNGHKMP